MDKTGYVIKVNGGEYDDAFTINVGISTDRAKAMEYVANSNRLLAQVNDKFHETQEALVAWCARNPAPNEHTVPQESLPVFKHGEKVSHARQKERMDIVGRNNEAIRQEYLKYQEKQDEQLQKLKDEIYTDEEREFMAQPFFEEYMIGEYCVFAMEEAPFI